MENEDEKFSWRYSTFLELNFEVFMQASIIF